jgi:hypothetical protein
MRFSKSKNRTNLKSDEAGFVAAEFVFALTMAAGIGIALFAITYTLTVVEVAQYIAFATSRAQIASHIDIDSQEKRGLDTYNQLKKDEIFKRIFSFKKNSTAWFSLPPSPEQKLGRNESDVFNEYPTSNNRVPNSGVRIRFVSKILNLKLPLLGRLMGEDSEGLDANVTSFLMREPTQKECQQQMSSRPDIIFKLDPRFQSYTSSSGGTNKGISMEDNGC